MAVTFQTTRRVEFADTDMAGIMHFSRFFVLMEEVEHEFLRSRGLSVIMNVEGRRIGWPRVGAKCDFKRPVEYEDVMDVELTIDRLGPKSLTFSIVFSKAGETVAVGQLTTCCVIKGEAGQMVSVEVPEAIRQRLMANS